MLLIDLIVHRIDSKQFSLILCGLLFFCSLFFYCLRHSEYDKVIYWFITITSVCVLICTGWTVKPAHNHELLKAMEGGQRGRRRANKNVEWIWFCCINNFGLWLLGSFMLTIYFNKNTKSGNVVTKLKIKRWAV